MKRVLRSTYVDMYVCICGGWFALERNWLEGFRAGPSLYRREYVAL